MLQQSLIRSDQNQLRTSISIEMNLLMTVTPSTHQNAFFAHAKSQYPSIIIETSYLQQHRVLRRLADDTYAVPTETSPQYLGLILSTVLGLRKRRFLSGDLG